VQLIQPLEHILLLPRRALLLWLLLLLVAALEQITAVAVEALVEVEAVLVIKITILLPPAVPIQ
jgi:hypothetical protein